jgi:hypothetical protein
MQYAGEPPFSRSTRSSCGNKDVLGIEQGAVLQNRLVHHVAALDATENPTSAVPAVIFKIDAHLRFHMPAATLAAPLGELPFGHLRCLGNHRVHGEPPSMFFSFVT